MRCVALAPSPSLPPTTAPLVVVGGGIFVGIHGGGIRVVAVSRHIVSNGGSGGEGRKW